MKLGGFDLARCCRNLGVGGYGYSHIDCRRLGLRARLLENGASACLPKATHLNVAAASSIRAVPPHTHTHINCPQRGLIQGLLQLQLPILVTATARRNDLEHGCFMAVRIVKVVRKGEKCSNLPLLVGNPKPQTLSPKP